MLQWRPGVIRHHRPRHRNPIGTKQSQAPLLLFCDAYPDFVVEGSARPNAAAFQGKASKAWLISSYLTRVASINFAYGDAFACYEER
jgi:hypothetical protein